MDQNLHFYKAFWKKRPHQVLAFDFSQKLMRPFFPKSFIKMEILIHVTKKKVLGKNLFFNFLKCSKLKHYKFFTHSRQRLGTKDLFEIGFRGPRGPNYEGRILIFHFYPSSVQ